MEKIRAAASVKVSKTKRLRERGQLAAGGNRLERAQKIEIERPGATTEPIVGEGIVLVGTSTGGPPALEALLAPLPKNFPLPILVAQHMPASFTGPFAKRLDALCAVQVVEVLRPVVLEPGCVYIGRGDADIIVSRRSRV